jgi:hypothetical protein
MNTAGRSSGLLRGHGVYTADYYSGHATQSLGWIWLPCGCVSCDSGCTHWRIVISAWETWTFVSADGVSFSSVMWAINFLLTFEIAQFFCVHTVYIYIYTYSITIIITYKVVQIWPGLFVCKQVTVCPGHIWTTLYFSMHLRARVGVCVRACACVFARKYGHMHVREPVYSYLSSIQRTYAIFCWLWPLRLSHIFPHYLIKSTTFGKKFLDKECVLSVSQQSCLKLW